MMVPICGVRWIIVNEDEPVSRCPTNTCFPPFSLPGIECENAQFCMSEACDSISSAFPGVAPSVAAVVCSQLCV